MLLNYGLKEHINQDGPKFTHEEIWFDLPGIYPIRIPQTMREQTLSYTI